MSKSKMQVYKYTSELRGEREVYTDYLGYLFLKLNYGVDGLTDEEYRQYKELSKQRNRVSNKN